MVYQHFPRLTQLLVLDVHMVSTTVALFQCMMSVRVCPSQVYSSIVIYQGLSKSSLMVAILTL